MLTFVQIITTITLVYFAQTAIVPFHTGKIKILKRPSLNKITTKARKARRARKCR